MSFWGEGFSGTVLVVRVSIVWSGRGVLWSLVSKSLPQEHVHELESRMMVSMAAADASPLPVDLEVASLRR